MVKVKVLSKCEHCDGKANFPFKEDVDYKGWRDLILNTDSVEVKYILEYLGYPAPDEEDPLEFSGLFVAVKDGDYEEVYAFE